MYGQNVPTPVAIHCTKWFNNTLSLGSFQSIRAGATLTDISNLPLGINNLFFAGSMSYLGLLLPVLRGILYEYRI